MSEIVNLHSISLKRIKDKILDLKISDYDTIYLHRNDFDELALQYRETYNYSLKIPFYFIGVHITASERTPVPLGTMIIERNNSKPESQLEQEELNPQIDIIYRCGWCGNIVNYDGSFMDNFSIDERKKLIRKFGTEIMQKRVDGACCRNRT